MWQSQSTKGEKCVMCGTDAAAKIGEEIMHDDPVQDRHNLTAYVCEQHFRQLFGDLGVNATEQLRKTPQQDDVVLGDKDTPHVE